MFMVLATILIVVVLANVVLTILSSQGRLTRHEVGRIQAFYAAQAGLIYTMEEIRLGTWTGSSVKYYCMALTNGGIGQCIDVASPDATIPYDWQLTKSGAYKVQIKVYFDGTGNPPVNTIRLDSKVDYTYR